MTNSFFLFLFIPIDDNDIGGSIPSELAYMKPYVCHISKDSDALNLPLFGCLTLFSFLGLLQPENLATV